MMRSLRYVIQFLRDDRISDRWALLFGFLRLTIMKWAPGHPNSPVTISGYKIHFADFDLFYHLFKEIFLIRSYQFECRHPAPLIIDAGANIGVSVLFFKSQYPRARVMCFEPEKTNFSLLRRNVTDNGLDNVSLHDVALSDHDGSIGLYVQADIEGGDIGASVIEEHRYHYHDKNKIKKVTIPCKRLSGFIQDAVEVHLLKLDVEGSEATILAELHDEFYKVDNLIMEYHYLGSKNPLSGILSLLEEHGHLYNLYGGTPIEKPFRHTYTLLIRSQKQLGPTEFLP